MTQQYYAILTDYGSQQLAQAIATHQPLNITHFAVGDGNGRETTPNPRYTALVQEVYRANISAVSKDPRNNQQVIFELTIPENVGGFYIREMGIFDAQNKLVGYANSPESFKPTEQSGSGKIQVIRMILRVSSSDAVQLTVDNSVIFASRHQLTPKSINASSQNNVDETGHSHQIAQASTAQAGITQLDNAINSNAEDRAATPKAVKTVKDLADSNTRSLQNVIPNSKKSNSVASTSSDTVATSYAVKQAYDLANSKQSPATTLAGYGITDFQVKSATGNLNDYRTAGIYSFNSISNSQNRPGSGFTGNLQVITGGEGNESWCHQIFRRHYSGEVYERWQTSGSNNNWSAWKRTDNQDGLPIGSIVSFPKEITNTRGFLRCTGGPFNERVYPELYQALGNKNKTPNLQRSDVGMLAYFPTDTIPDGWIAFDSIRSVVNATSYPELYRYLIAKYRSISNVPLAEDRFIRNAGNGLGVGDKQEEEIKAHIHGVGVFTANNDAAFIMGNWQGEGTIPSTRGRVIFGEGSYHGNPSISGSGTVSTSGSNSPIVTSTPDSISGENQKENRPKSIVFKLCIKAKNSFDDVVFWIKAFGEVVNVGQLDASRLAQDLQQVRSEKANIDHTHTVSQIADFNPEVVKLINQHSGFTQQIAESGWTVLPNGLMLQWGVSNSTEIYFPRAFPVRCFVVSHSKTAGNRDTRVNNITNTKFNSYASSHPGTTYYIAIGH